MTTKRKFWKVKIDGPNGKTWMRGTHTFRRKLDAEQFIARWSKACTDETADASVTRLYADDPTPPQLAMSIDWRAAFDAEHELGARLEADNARLREALRVSLGESHSMTMTEVRALARSRARELYG